MPSNMINKNSITNTNQIIVNAEPKEKSSCFIEKLKQLSELKSIGILNEDEFNIQKGRLLR